MSQDHVVCENTGNAYRYVAHPNHHQNGWTERHSEAMRFTRHDAERMARMLVSEGANAWAEPATHVPEVD